MCSVLYCDYSLLRHIRAKLLPCEHPISFSTHGHQQRFITAQCTLVQSAVFRSHDVHLSVCLSVRLSVTLAKNECTYTNSLHGRYTGLLGG